MNETKTLTLIVTPGEAGRALLDVLTRRLDCSRRQAKQRLDSRRVMLNDQRVWMAQHRVAAGDCIRLPPEAGAPAPVGPAGRADPSARPIRLLHRDQWLVVADKPAGCLTNAAPDSLEARLRSQTGQPLAAVHRLDRDTTGCVLLASDRDTERALIEAFKSRRVIKTYHAIVSGHFREREFTIDRPIENQPAVTHLRVLDDNPRASHVSLLIETGRTHQIRRHLAGLRHPVLGDAQYAVMRATASHELAPRQMLHAAGLAFHHPVTGAALRFRAPLPADFRHCLRALGLT